ncbi:response regulator transcription factor [Paenibacillus eucommiae]|uniref:Two-component system response regulator YesN n=1 Tax=Paenibacillus eucommiae TaxID=1355755 RepID=A0ABS4J1H7_9BACL|nr:response regulator [Paenibacillus eucommiae]MBP1992981.1 two-component system response regulator YesN [Paenibacillus eucommiae]
MNNVLVIDDEPIILEALYNTLMRMEEHDLIIWKASSAIEGIEIMRSNRIDILMTDVRMPVMSGLELVGLVRKQWERCKIIILSGYSDYEYLQPALQQNVFDYLLKPIDEEVIVETISRVITEIETNMQMQDLMAKAENQLQKAQSLLHKDFSENLFSGDLLTQKMIAESVEMLQIPVRCDQDVIVVVGRTDRWPQGYSLKEKLLMHYAINNIMNEYLNSACRIVPFIEKGYMVWLIQVAESDGDNREYQDLNTLHWYIGEVLDKIQQSIRQYLKLPISLLLSKPNIGWLSIARTFKEMCAWLQSGIGLEEEIIFIEQIDNMKPNYEGREQSYIDIKRSMNQLLNLIESGNLATFQKELSDFFRSMQGTVFLEYSLQLEIYVHLSGMFLSYINNRKISPFIDGDLEMQYLSNYSLFPQWSDMEAYFLRLTDHLFSLAQGENRSQKKEIVDEIDAYIIESFSSEYISLSHLAKTFHLSTSYLSRLYHSEKGICLTERMKQLRLMRAKELLLVEGKKIQDVALELGFYNAPYFTKFFKKNIGITPQEYKQNLGIAPGGSSAGNDNK